MNPLRTHASVITLISLLGVLLGVTVLIVVLSVFGGFEKLIKDRVLSYTPHIYIERYADWPDPDVFPEYNAEEEWRSLEASMNKLSGIKSTYALVNDYVLLDRAGAIAPATMQAIDTANADQTRSLQELITEGNGSSDMGLGENVVISSITAGKFGIAIGDTVQLHTVRNLEKIKPALERIDTPPLAESHAETLAQIKEDIVLITTLNVETPARESIAIAELKSLYYDKISPLLSLNLRDSEREIIHQLLLHYEQGERTTADPDDSGVFLFPAEHKVKALLLIDSLASLNISKDDLDGAKQIKNLVLPKDMSIIGIYQATPHAVSPDFFVPLPVGQDLTGLGDGIRGVALILDEPYDADRILNEVVLPVMPIDGSWQARTWMQDHAAQFSWIKTQRQLLSFCLSFIMLVSAFSIMAVMFTVTIQKKREIGVMKALGANPAQLVKVFLYQGIIIGILGGILGLLAGYTVVMMRNDILAFFADLGFDPFPSEINGFEGLPAIINPMEFLAVFVFAFIMCVIATLVPAMIASRSDAAKSLRNT